MDKNILAMLGFFAHQNSCMVECAFCFLQIKSWAHDDDILAVHKKLSPNCPFMTQRETRNIPIDPEALASKLGPRPHSDTCGSGLNNTIESRMDSYVSWPIQIKQTPEYLSAAGFYYTGFGDIVKCYKCHITLSNWQPNDDAIEEHTKFSPGCPLMISFRDLNKNYL